ncbi:Metal-dependent hydrolase, beta-lactamase superfamily II [Mucilaginibacter sp. OK268]|uniref:ComEC/Rec2 family competence protein n=1 Tax=Mucilaginibacter sp. OK268 TaxID=1881048 RepID=UPI00088F12BC|nr:MBL fold metallo-hydrolase [Mucilaginibacter sp. OK268]SDQ01216.1 Metal-dependent hydrolase, beta-lactamase superfamily II [Mucilaginibacter sp. OK268]
MDVKVLKAGSGDCILIQHQNHNILIDGGNDSVYLLIQIDEIYKKGQAIDLLIITHHDDDHIKGIIDLLKLVVDGKYGENFIRQAIFNSPRLISGKILPIDDRSLSYKQAHDVEDLLLKIQSKWTKTTNDTKPIVFEDLTLTFLSPISEDLDTYSQQTGAYLSSDFKCDWKSPMAVLERFIDDDSQDISLPNRTSIVILLECEGKRILLPGDTTPGRMEQIINKLAAESEHGRAAFDYVKLPHHASYRSLNKNIVEKIACTKFIISTNSKKHYLPNKRALLKIYKFLKREDEQIEFLFNYEESLNNLEITEAEKKKYRIKLTGNNRNYGIGI